MTMTIVTISVNTIIPTEKKSTAIVIKIPMTAPSALMGIGPIDMQNNSEDFKNKTWYTDALLSENY